MAKLARTSHRLTHEEDEENEQEELSDKQIQQLLREATARLTNSSQNDKRLAASTQTSGRLIPKLQTTNPHAPYIRDMSGVAVSDPKLLISEEQRKLSDTLRSVDTAAPSKKTVSYLCNSCLYFI
jgi:hypothetical protein